MSSSYDDGFEPPLFPGEEERAVTVEAFERQVVAEMADEIIRTAYEALFQTPNGEIVLKDLMTQAGLFASSFAAEATTTAYNEGRRSLLLHILERAGANNLEAQNAMMRERALGLKHKEIA